MTYSHTQRQTFVPTWTLSFVNEMMSLMSVSGSRFVGTGKAIQTFSSLVSWKDRSPNVPYVENPGGAEPAGPNNAPAVNSGILIVPG